MHGFGFLVRKCGNVEFRNFTVMAFMDDGISLDTDNCNIWVHNMDLFYGSTGGDADQAKGDGSVDIKGASTYVTVSYVHFWDSGKCSLCGMSDSSEFLVTYHHNWFDHSDSRHPRIRVATEEFTEIESSEVESSGEEIVTGDVKVVAVNGWNESLYMELSNVKDSNVTSVSYSGAMSGTLSGEDLEYLVRDYNGGVRVDIPGLKAGTYSVTVKTNKGDVTKTGISVASHDKSGYAHFNYTSGVGAYNDDGTLKSNAIVLYVTDSNKNSVSVTSKDGTKVTGIGNILNSAGRDSGNGATSKGGKPNTNAEIIKKLAKDGTPLVVRIVGDVTAPSGVTEYDSLNYGGSEGDNGYMARIQDGTVVSSKNTVVSSDNAYASFELDSSLGYIASDNYLLHTNTSTLKDVVVAGAGTMK